MNRFIATLGLLAALIAAAPAKACIPSNPQGCMAVRYDSPALHNVPAPVLFPAWETPRHAFERARAEHDAQRAIFLVAFDVYHADENSAQAKAAYEAALDAYEAAIGKENALLDEIEMYLEKQRRFIWVLIISTSLLD